MLGKIVLLLLPVVLKAKQVCEGNECRVSIESRILGGESSEPHLRPFQVCNYGYNISNSFKTILENYVWF